jgi:hypothetical protein
MEIQREELLPTKDFPVVSEGEGNDDLEVGGWVMRVEDVFQATNDWDFDSNTWSFDRGVRVGTLYLELVRPTESRVVLTATFEFDDGDVVVLKGVVPYDDGARRLGGGRIATLGGTGKFRMRHGIEVPLQVRNPKRWG